MMIWKMMDSFSRGVNSQVNQPLNFQGVLPEINIKKAAENHRLGERVSLDSHRFRAFVQGVVGSCLPLLLGRSQQRSFWQHLGGLGWTDLGWKECSGLLCLNLR